MLVVTRKAEDWIRLGRMVRERRDDLGLTQQGVAAMGLPGLSTTNLQDIEGAKRESYRSGTLRSLCKALQWSPGSIDAILDGGYPDAVVMVNITTDGERRLAEAFRMSEERERIGRLRRGDETLEPMYHPGVEEAIAADADLDPIEKEALILRYRTMKLEKVLRPSPEPEPEGP